MKRITLEKWLINHGFVGKITSLKLPDNLILWSYDTESGEKKRVKELTHFPDKNTGRKFKVVFVDGTIGWRRTFEYVVEEIPAPKLHLDKFDVPKDTGTDGIWTTRLSSMYSEEDEEQEDD